MAVHPATRFELRTAAPVVLLLLLPLCRSAAAQQDAAADGTAAFVGSYRALEESWPADVATPLSTQVTPMAQPPPPPNVRAAPAESSGWRFEIAGLYESVELDSVSGHTSDWYGNSGRKVFEWNDIDRVRYGGRFLAGSGSLRFGVEFFSESFDSTSRFTGNGGGMILSGSPTVARAADYAWLVDYGLRLGYVHDHGSVQMLDSFGGVISGQASLEYEYALLDLGAGLRFDGFEIAAGLRLDDTVGYFDVDRGGHYYLDGANFAFYTRVEFQPRGLPVFANATLFLGDVRGAGFVLGLRF